MLRLQRVWGVSAAEMLPASLYYTFGIQGGGSVGGEDYTRA